MVFRTFLAPGPWRWENSIRSDVPAGGGSRGGGERAGMLLALQRFQHPTGSGLVAFCLQAPWKRHETCVKRWCETTNIANRKLFLCTGESPLRSIRHSKTWEELKLHRMRELEGVKVSRHLLKGSFQSLKLEAQEARHVDD